MSSRCLKCIIYYWINKTACSKGKNLICFTLQCSQIWCRAYRYNWRNGQTINLQSNSLRVLHDIYNNTENKINFKAKLYKGIFYLYQKYKPKVQKHMKPLQFICVCKLLSMTYKMIQHVNLDCEHRLQLCSPNGPLCTQFTDLHAQLDRLKYYLNVT